jgi:hypothetical protein
MRKVKHCRFPELRWRKIDFEIFAHHLAYKNLLMFFVLMVNLQFDDEKKIWLCA